MGETIVAPEAKPAASVEPKVNGAQSVAKPAEPTREITVNGKKQNVTDAQLIALAQKGAFADQQFKSMGTLKSKTESLLTALKTPEGLLGILKDPALGNSPKEVLRKLLASDVIDDELKEDIAKWTYENVVQKSKLTPEQLEQEKKLSDYERLKKADEARKTKDLSEQQNAKVQQIYQAVRSEVTKQIIADKTFPQTEGSIRAVVEKLRVMNKQGAPVSAESIAKALTLVKKDHLLHQQSLLDADKDAPDYAEKLIERIGEERALAISRALVARLKAKEKVKLEKKEADDDEKLDSKIQKKFGMNKHGYRVMDV